MPITFTKLALDLVSTPNPFDRVRIAKTIDALLETAQFECHPVESLLRKQMIALIRSCLQQLHSANAHSLLEVAEFYDKHFTVTEVQWEMAA